MPMIGLAKSSSAKPTARSMARFGVRSTPCVMALLLVLLLIRQVVSCQSQRPKPKNLLTTDNDYLFHFLVLELPLAPAVTVDHVTVAAEFVLVCSQALEADRAARV